MTRDIGRGREFREQQKADRINALLGEKYTYKRTIHYVDEMREQVHIVAQYAIDEKTGEKHEMRDVVFKEIAPMDHTDTRDTLHKIQSTQQHRLERELEVLKKLSNNPFVITIYDLIRNPESGRIAGMILEYVPGGDISENIHEIEGADNSEGRMFEQDIATVGYCVSMALSDIHTHGLVHRDIKPKNILIDDHVAKIIDFNITRSDTGEDFDMSVQGEVADDLFTHTYTDEGMVQGTAAYMSPEQVRGEGVGALSDLYNLGATLYEMRTGSPVFTGYNQQIVAAAHINNMPVPPHEFLEEEELSIDRVIMALLEKNPVDRKYISLPDGREYYITSTADLAEVFEDIVAIHDSNITERTPFSL